MPWINASGPALQAAATSKEEESGGREMVLQMSHLKILGYELHPGTAGDDELKKRASICRQQTARGPAKLTTEWARLIYGQANNSKEIKIDLHLSMLGEKWEGDTDGLTGRHRTGLGRSQSVHVSWVDRHLGHHDANTHSFHEHSSQSVLEP